MLRASGFLAPVGAEAERLQSAAVKDDFSSLHKRSLVEHPNLVGLSELVQAFCTLGTRRTGRTIGTGHLSHCLVCVPETDN